MRSYTSVNGERGCP